MGVHNTEETVRSCLESILKCDLPKKEKNLIAKFHDECYSQGLSHTRVLFYLDKLKNMRIPSDNSYIKEKLSDKPFYKWDKEEIKGVVGKIEKCDKYSEWTKAGYRITIKKFIQWLNGHEWNSREYPKKVKWIRTIIKKNNHKLPEELLTKEDIETLIKNSQNIRDKTLISVLYESGCRVGELLEIKLKHVVFDEYGARIRIHGKTGTRWVRLVSSVPRLSNWVNDHPNNGNNDSYLFVNIGTENNGKGMKYGALRMMLRKIAKRGNIQKSVNPHMFRHSRATRLAGKLTEAQMKEYFGWVQSSSMASVYVHMSGRDVDNAILRMHGKLPDGEKKREEELKTKDCQICKFENAPELDHCSQCGRPLSIEVALREQEKRNEREALVLNNLSDEEYDRLVEKIAGELIQRKDGIVDF